MNSNTSIFYDQQLLAIKLGDIYNSDIKKKLTTLSKKKTILPATDTIYNREVVMELNPIKEEKNLKSSNQKSKKKYNDEYYDGYFNNEYDDKKYKYIEFDKKENENYSDNNFILTREKSENLSNKNIEFHSNNPSHSSSNNKFISKSKSPINIKKKVMSLKQESEKNESINSNNLFLSPTKSENLINLENEKNFYNNYEISENKKRFSFKNNNKENTKTSNEESLSYKISKNENLDITNNLYETKLVSENKNTEKISSCSRSSGIERFEIFLFGQQ